MQTLPPSANMQESIPAEVGNQQNASPVRGMHRGLQRWPALDGSARQPSIARQRSPSLRHEAASPWALQARWSQKNRAV
jgi:hypothetical protein